MVDVAKTTKNPRARSLTAVHAAWCIGPRRVAIACAEDTRPAACCIVDALVARGYDVVLQTGSDARSALRRDDDDPGRLRVLWIPDYGDRPTKERLRRALDPQGAGDVLVLASPTPRGVIEAIEAFAAGRDRPRVRSGPRRTYLDHPTRIEASLDVGGFLGAAVASAGATAALFLAIRIGGEMLAPTAQASAATSVPVEATARPAAPRPRAIDPTVLGSAVAPLPPAIEDDVDELEGMSPPPAKPKRERTSSRKDASDEAPLEDVIQFEAAAPIVLEPTHEPTMPRRTKNGLIDPFAD